MPLRWKASRLADRVRATPRGFRVPHSQFWCDSEDGVRLAGSVLGPESATTALVLAHGFMGYRTKLRNRLLAERLAQDRAVFAFDMRGHGQSSGACSGGVTEALDVHAVVQHARGRGFERVVVIGWSLGGIAVVRAAALYGDVDGVVAISTPSRWGTESKAVRRTTWIFTSRVGRRLARELMGTTIDLQTDTPDPPVAMVGKLAPTPVLFVHGLDDHFFGPDAARELYAAAGQPKRLLLLDGFGHAEDGFTPAFAARLAAEIDRMVPAVQ